MSRRTFLKSTALAGAATAAGVTAAHAQPATVRVRHHRVPWRVRRPVRVAHLTDVHVGWSTPEAVLSEAARLAHMARPDLTVLTGDYVNTSLTHRATLERFVRGLPGPVFATLGNHDHWTDGPGVTRALEAAGATVLSNAAVTVQPAGGPLEIVGVDDARSGHDDVPRAFSRVAAPAHALVLSHDPGATERVVGGGAKLVLSGHTHGGQVRIPRLTDKLGRAVGQPYLDGWYTVNDARLYVNVGLGHSRAGLRVGKGAAAELAVLDLVPAAAS